jgi:type II secretory pathway component PulF
MALFSPQLSTKTLVPMCRQIATAYDAGITITQALALARNATGDKHAQVVLDTMAYDIRNGATLGEAAAAQSKRLPPILISLLASGEAGGRLDVMLRDLASYYEDRLAMRRKLFGMMAYPAFQLIVAWFLGTFALGLVGSLNLNATTPFSVGSYFQTWLGFQAGVLASVGLALAVFIGLSRAGVTGNLASMFAIRVWPFSVVAKRFALARFFRSMALLIQSGLPIQKCIDHAAAAANNGYVAAQVRTAIPRVMEGASLQEAFAPVSVLTPQSREMLHVGEVSGNLDGSLRKIADYHLAEANHAVSIATKLANVGIVLLVGLVVGYVVISFYTSYFRLLDQI